MRPRPRFRSSVGSEKGEEEGALSLALLQRARHGEGTLHVAAIAVPAEGRRGHFSSEALSE